LSMVARVVYTEDTYGVEFHREIIGKLVEKGIISGLKPRVERIPSGLCNEALARKVRARLLDYAERRIVFVIDREDLDRDEASRRVLGHFRDREREGIRVVVVEPMHEAWLCIGLGLDRVKCRSDPVAEITRSKSGVYEKHLLGKLASQVDIDRLLSEDDFRDYIDALKWLTTP